MPCERERVIVYSPSCSVSGASLATGPGSFRDSCGAESGESVGTRCAGVDQASSQPSAAVIFRAPPIARVAGVEHVSDGISEAHPARPVDVELDDVSRRIRPLDGIVYCAH